MLRRASAPVVIVAALCSMLAPGPPAHAASSGQIAFSSLPNHTFGIWTIDPDGTGGKFRVPGTTPAWSPDGRLMAYISPDERIVIHGKGGDVDTGVPAAGYDIFSGARVVWSPDGTKLAYGYNIEIWVMNAMPPYDPVQLTRSDCGDYAPTWSPDSTKIAYQGTCQGGILTINADGTGKTRVPTPVEMSAAYAPDWSPDGTQFVVLAEGHSQDQTGIWVMGVDGTNPQFVVATVEFCCGSPDWSADGTKIVFVGNDGLTTVNPDGSDLTVVTTKNASQPQWQGALG